MHSSKPSPPPPVAPPPVVKDNVTASRKAQQQEVSRATQRVGRRSTILTGPTGLTEEANIKKKTLLGS